MSHTGGVILMETRLGFMVFFAGCGFTGLWKLGDRIGNRFAAAGQRYC